MFSALVVLPYVLILVGLFTLLVTAYRSHSPERALFLYPLIFSLLVTCAFAAWGHYSIATSRSSTAAIGYLFLPCYSLAVAAVGFLISWSILYLIRFANNLRKGGSKTLSTAVLAGFAVLTLSVSGMTAARWAVRQKLLVEAASVTTHPLDIKEILADAISAHDLEVLALLARNPNTSLKNLTLIYDACEPHIADFNPLEYVVFLALAQNERTPPDMLVALAKCQQSTVRLAVGTNPGTPNDTLKDLSKDRHNLVRYWLVSNPSIPRELLVQLASDPDELVQRHARQYLSAQRRAQH